MTVLYGLPTCDTTRKARNWLDRFGIAHEFVDYREQRQPPSASFHCLSVSGGWDGLVNKQSNTWRGLPEARKAPHSDPEWTLLLKEYPALIKRPVLVTDDGTVSVGFADNSYKKRFGIEKK